MAGSEYHVTITIKNGLLLGRIRAAGYKTVAAFVEASGVSPTVLYPLLALKQTPLLKNGEWRSYVIRIANFLFCNPEDLFPVNHIRSAMKTNKIEIATDYEQLMGLTYATEVADDSPQPDQVLALDEGRKALADVLETLRPRETLVLSKRFGLDGEGEHTLEEVGKMLKITRERVRGIEASALRRLKHGSKMRKILPFASELGVCAWDDKYFEDQI